MSWVRIISASMPPMRKKRMAKPPYSMPIRLWSTVVSQLTRPVLAVGRVNSSNDLAGACPAPVNSDFASASAMGNAGGSGGMPAGYFRPFREGTRGAVSFGALKTEFGPRVPLFAGFHVADHAAEAVEHLVARLEIFGILNPLVHALRCVFQHAGGDAGTGADMREIGTDDARTVMTADGVAGNAGLVLEKLAARGDEGGVFAGPGVLLLVPGGERIGVKAGRTGIGLAGGQFQAGKLDPRALGLDGGGLGGDAAGGPFLVGEPLHVFNGGKRDDPEANDGVRFAAILGALAVEITGLARLEPEEVRAVRDHVHLAGELGNPETVDYIDGAEMHAHGRARRHDQLVAHDEGGLAAAGERHHLAVILELEPPLVAGDGDVHGVALLGLRHIVGVPDVAQGGDGDDDEQYDGAGNEADLDEGVAMARYRCRLGVLVGIGLGAEFNLRVGQHRADDDEDESRHIDRDHEQIPLPLGNGPLRDHRGLRAAEAEDLVQLVAAGQQGQAEPGKQSCGKARNFAVGGT